MVAPRNAWKRYVDLSIMTPIGMQTENRNTGLLPVEAWTIPRSTHGVDQHEFLAQDHY